METETGEIRMEKAERRRSKRESRKEVRGKGKEEETEEGENNRCEESSRGIGNLR